MEKVNDDDVTIVNTGCCHDCGGRCVLRAHVKDGKIIRFETDNDEEPQIRACLRGRAYRQRVYNPNRVKYPLRRVGGRGEGKFERISWDEALEEVASKMIEIKEKYGNSAILIFVGGGDQGMIHGPVPPIITLLQFGGFTRWWGGASYEGALFASMATYGTIKTGHAREDFLNSKLIIMWGWNPANTVWDPGTSLMLAKAREKGIKFVSIDPIFTDTTGIFADQWIPIRPGTEYVLGIEDGQPKTPEWAEEITTVPAETIRNLAREYATTKPAALVAGWGAARTAMGEQYSRAANVLIAITGNIGISGGYASGFMRAYSSREMMGVSRKKKKAGPLKESDKPKKRRGQDNPVDFGAPPRKNSLYKLTLILPVLEFI
ncbi:MAG: molybdopterin-dependent oxidoreductase [Promethearchaeota archaeon]